MATNNGNALLRSVRTRVLESLREPGSAVELARRLEMPRQKVNYHLRALEEQGLVELVEERRRGNCVERVVKATAKSYLVGAEALGRLAATPEGGADRFSSAYAVSAAARMVRDVAVLRDRAEGAGLQLPTMTIEAEVAFDSPGARHAFAEALANHVADLAATYGSSSESARRFRLLVGMHPALASPLDVPGPPASSGPPPDPTPYPRISARAGKRASRKRSSSPKATSDDPGDTT